MKKLTYLTIFYFALSGALLHAGAGYIYAFNKPLYEKVKYVALEKLENYFPVLARTEPAVEQNYNLDSEIELNFGRWQPVKNYPIREKSDVFYSDDFSSLTNAGKSLNDGATLIIKEGAYQQPLIIEANDVTIIGQGHVVIERTAAERKAAIVIKGNYTRIANIECRYIEVRDGNGACIRLEGSNLDVNYAYFHSSQQGLLSGKNSGMVTIRNSRFEKLGHKGYAHGIYIGGGELRVNSSLFIAAKDQGHEIKSRAYLNEISNSKISSMSSKNSRLIDISEGGILRITDSVLHQGPMSANFDAIGFALEKVSYKENEIELKRNTIILERHGENRFIHTPTGISNVQIADNVIIGKNTRELNDQNITFESRQDAGLPPYPALLNVNHSN